MKLRQRRLLSAGERRHRQIGSTARRKVKRKQQRLTPRELGAALSRRTRY